MEPSRNHNYIKLSLFAVIFIGFGIFLLNAVGQLFIREVVYEVALELPSEVSGDIKIGAKAPHWELSDLAGIRHSTSDFLGKPLVIIFWTTWNPLAADQIKVLDDYLLRQDETLFEVVTINSQEERSIVANFMRRGGYRVKVMLDETGETGEEFKVQTVPLAYFLDKEGIIQDIFVGVLDGQMIEARLSKTLQ